MNDTYTKEIFWENSIIVEDSIRLKIEDIIFSAHLEVSIKYMHTTDKTKEKKDLTSIYTLLDKFLKNETEYKFLNNALDDIKYCITDLEKYTNNKRKVAPSQAEAKIKYKAYTEIKEILKNAKIKKYRTLSIHLLSINGLEVNPNKKQNYKGIYL